MPTPSLPSPSLPSPSLPTLSPGGVRLLQFLDGLPVEERWVAGHRVVWQTGQQDGPDGVGPENHTHCSALTAAICLDLDIYLLRPPNHSQELLANAQTDWLAGSAAWPGPSAAQSGWQSLGATGEDGALDAALLAANAGRIVLAGYRQPPTTDPLTGATVQRPGHVAILRPQTDLWTAEQGPDVTMAGERNWARIRMQAAFSSHQDAWPDRIGLFAHDTDLQFEFAAAAGLG